MSKPNLKREPKLTQDTKHWIESTTSNNKETNLNFPINALRVHNVLILKVTLDKGPRFMDQWIQALFIGWKL
jgi:hypothetical protein